MDRPKGIPQNALYWTDDGRYWPNDQGWVTGKPRVIPDSVIVPCKWMSREREVFNLPKNASERKKQPITSGVLDYFPDAIAEIAKVSWQGNEQHNPGQPLHWAREKSTDHADCVGRHLLQRGTIDSDGMRHSAKLAWRALALLQLELEAEQVK